MDFFPHKKQNGFTLLELLIAISVFAVMSFMAYGGLSNVIANSESSKAALERLHTVQLSMFNIGRDLSQIAKRNIRDEFGDSQNYILSGGNNDSVIEFTRNGRRNPANLLRSNLVRVAYKLEEGNLIRMQWPQLDRVQGMIPYENTLLTDVTNLNLRFLDNSAKWHDEWPPLNSAGTTSGTPGNLEAIEMKITLNDWGEIRRLIKASS